MKRRRSLLLCIAILAIVGSIWSYVLITAPPQETLDQREHDVASQLKCLVCQGELVADSPALLSQQMRAIIRQQLQSGKSEQEVIQYFVSRYGNRILWSPPWQGFTLLAWLIPIGLLLGGALLLFFVLRGWLTQANAASPGDGALTLEGMDESELAQYRQQIEKELQEVELDFQLGNLAEGDYRSLHERYTRRAVLATKSHHEHEQELDKKIEERLRTMREEKKNVHAKE